MNGLYSCYNYMYFIMFQSKVINVFYELGSLQVQSTYIGRRDAAPVLNVAGRPVRLSMICCTPTLYFLKFRQHCFTELTQADVTCKIPHLLLLMH